LKVVITVIKQFVSH